jgi:hypothetical protein
LGAFKPSAGSGSNCFIKAVVIDDKYWSGPQRKRWRDWAIDAIPEDKFGTRYVSDWSEVTDGAADGQRMIVTDANGNDASFTWSVSEAKWVLQSTGHEWVLLEDWSSGSIQTNIWSQGKANGTDNLLSYTVESGSNRVAFSLPSSAATTQESMVLKPFFGIAGNNAEFRIEANANGGTVPTSGMYGLRSISYFNSIFDDAVQSSLQAGSGAGYEWEVYNRPVGGGSSTPYGVPAGTFAALLRLVSGSYEFQEEITQFHASLLDGPTRLDSTYSTTTGFTHIVNTEPQKVGILVFTSANINHTVYLGKIWVKK